MAKTISANRWKQVRAARLLYLMILPSLLYLLLFKYLPMFGLLIAFKEYSPFKGVLGSPWVGLKHFHDIFFNPYFYTLLKNTVLLSLFSLVFGFPIPIIFALLLNEIRTKFFRRFVQSVSLFPYFISSAVAVGILYSFLSVQGGIVNNILGYFNIESIFFMGEPRYFRSLFVGLGVWQGFGYASIIYLAAIAGVDPSLYEAAEIDGASRWRKMWHVTLPSIRHTIMILFIINMGSILSVDLDRILLMYNPRLYETADVIQSYVYRIGFGLDGFPNYSFAAAMGFFHSVVGCVLIFTANQISKRLTETRLF